MDKSSILKAALTVILATAVIISGAYAFGVYNRANDPLAVASDFYQEWMEYQGSPLADKFYLDHSSLSQKLEDKIDHAVSTFDKGGYDPVLMAQDKPSRIEMETTRRAGKTAIVTVTEYFGGADKKLKVDLAKEGWKWQISDIRDVGAGSGQTLADDAELQARVGDHIRDNISELSPKEAVLGGAFYVTEIRFEDGNKAIVEYEDGHIALQAEARYELLPDSTVRIDKFTIVKDHQD